MPQPRGDVPLKQLYDAGVNIMAHCREAEGAAENSEHAIAAAYDLQAGSYVRQRDDPTLRASLLRYTAEVAGVLRGLGPTSLLEAGVGEATTLCDVLAGVPVRAECAWGFDISWSRIAVGREYARRAGHPGVTLFTGSLFHIPVCDNAFDVVYTSHSIEPNRGREMEAVRELHRVARSHVVLFEPIYELAGEEARRRMDRHAYCRGLHEQVERAGLTVIDYRLLEHCVNPLNPTGVIVIAKPAGADRADPRFVCPRSRRPLTRASGNWFCEESLVVYPSILGIPCLAPENGVIASKYLEHSAAAP